MSKICSLVLLLVFFMGCKSSQLTVEKNLPSDKFTVAFGSCNKHTLDNLLWDDIMDNEPDLWIWGGDIIYADTDDVSQIRTMYAAQNKVAGYQRLKSEIAVVGTWDDHDYGLNDGGVEFTAKEGSQQAFLDFMDVPENSPRRAREGIYTSHEYDLPSGKIKIIVLDTRYFRTALTPDNETEKRNKPNPYGQGTILGEAQWKWLVNELKTSEADFNLIVSSVQFLSNEHGFECWGNFPHEVNRLKKLISDSKAKGVIILSGDRHISEFSREDVDSLSFPLIDFTSSGLTHAYRNYSGEPNPFRVGEVVATESFGLIQFNLKSRLVKFKIIGDGGEVLQKLQQQY